MSHMKFKETVKKLYVRVIYGGHFGFYVKNICSTQYILVFFLNLKRFHNYCNLCRVTPSFVTGCPDYCCRPDSCLRSRCHVWITSHVFTSQPLNHFQICIYPAQSTYSAHFRFFSILSPPDHYKHIFS